MSSTQTTPDTLQLELDKANPNTLADCLRLMKLGTMSKLIKATTGVQTAFTTLTVAQLLAFAGITAAGIDGVLPTAFKQIKTLRVVASGTATSVGAYIVTDSGGTAAVPPGGANSGAGVALLSDDGTTLTFPNSVTNVCCEFYPESATALTAAFGESV